MDAMASVEPLWFSVFFVFHTLQWCDEICVYLRDLRAICDGAMVAMSSAPICAICGFSVMDRRPIRCRIHPKP